MPYPFGQVQEALRGTQQAISGLGDQYVADRANKRQTALQNASLGLDVARTQADTRLGLINAAATERQRGEETAFRNLQFKAGERDRQLQRGFQERGLQLQETEAKARRDEQNRKLEEERWLNTIGTFDDILTQSLRRQGADDKQITAFKENLFGDPALAQYRNITTTPAKINDVMTFMQTEGTKTDPWVRSKQWTDMSMEMTKAGVIPDSDEAKALIQDARAAGVVLRPMKKDYYANDGTPLSGWFWSASPVEYEAPEPPLDTLRNAYPAFATLPVEYQEEIVNSVADGTITMEQALGVAQELLADGATTGGMGTGIRNNMGGAPATPGWSVRGNMTPESGATIPQNLQQGAGDASVRSGSSGVSGDFSTHAGPKGISAEEESAIYNSPALRLGRGVRDVALGVDRFVAGLPGKGVRDILSQQQTPYGYWY
jgi:hypothetical protein